MLENPKEAFPWCKKFEKFYICDFISRLLLLVDKIDHPDLHYILLDADARDKSTWEKPETKRLIQSLSNSNIKTLTRPGLTNGTPEQVFTCDHTLSRLWSDYHDKYMVPSKK